MICGTYTHVSEQVLQLEVDEPVRFPPFHFMTRHALGVGQSHTIDLSVKVVVSAIDWLETEILFTAQLEVITDAIGIAVVTLKSSEPIKSSSVVPNQLKRACAKLVPAHNGYEIWVLRPPGVSCRAHYQVSATISGGKTEPNYKPIHDLAPERSPVAGRTCLKCGHVECPCCEDWCDELVGQDMDLCCDGQCTFAAPRDPRLQNWLDHLPQMIVIGVNAEGFYHWSFYKAVSDA